MKSIRIGPEFYYCP